MYIIIYICINEHSYKRNREKEGGEMTANNRVRKLQSVRENFTEMKFKSGHEGCL